MYSDVRAINDVVERESAFIDAISAEISKVIVGQEHMVERLLIGLLTGGHVLLEGVPGLAKTLTVKTLCDTVSAKFRRIQFTPDLLPADLIGTVIYNQQSGQFTAKKGPIFANLVLADEINRAPAKVQAALLEAMEERQVTVSGTTHALPGIFLVMATQNPIEHEGTYPLPEAQMDRFLMHVRVGYPSLDAELDVVRLVRAEEGAGGAVASPVAPRNGETLSQRMIFAARDAVRALHVAPAIDRYVVDLVRATREPGLYAAELATWIEVGASPRGAIGLDRCARAHAWLAGRDFVAPDDVRAVAHDVLRHRLMLSYEANAGGIDPDRAIDGLLQRVAAP
jgi:MoxR-like ATPase